MTAISVTFMTILKKAGPEKFDIVMGKLIRIFGKIKKIGKSDKK